MGGVRRTTITVSRVIKDRFLGYVGAPKRFSSADEALAALLDLADGKEEMERRSEAKIIGVRGR